MKGTDISLIGKINGGNMLTVKGLKGKR